MKRNIDLEKAAAGETFGALAVGRIGKRKASAHGMRGPLTAAQARAFSELVHYLLDVVKEAGAHTRRVRIGGLSLKIEEKSGEDILSVRGA
jgi:hypothetical protein